MPINATKSHLPIAKGRQLLSCANVTEISAAVGMWSDNLRVIFAGIYIAHGLYAPTPNLAFGVEALMQRGMHPALGQVVTQFSGSVVGRYKGELVDV